MHAIFIPYGIKSAVEHLMMDMQAQKFKMPIYDKKGKQVSEAWIQGSLRILPFGIWEYIFPKESMDVVLTTLDFPLGSKKDATGGYAALYTIKGKAILNMIRKALGAKKEPKNFKKEHKLIWIRDNVAIIPIGIREDAMITEIAGPYKDHSHEAI